MAPLVGVLLSLVMYIGSDHVIRSNSALLADLHATNLPQISEVSRFRVKLSDNHSRLTSSLIAALVHADEERVSITARENLFILHDTEQGFAGQLSMSTEHASSRGSKIDSPSLRWTTMTSCGLSRSTGSTDWVETMS